KPVPPELRYRSVGVRPRRRSVATRSSNRVEAVLGDRRPTRPGTHEPPAEQGGTHAAPARAGAVGRGRAGRTDGPGAAAVDGEPDRLSGCTAALGCVADVRVPAKPKPAGTDMKKTLIASLLLCAATAAAQDQEFGSTVITNLTAVRSDPDAFRNVKVEFVVQSASLGSLSNPFFTRFTPADYMNLYAWADEQPIWQQTQFDNPFGMLFYSKQGNKLAEVFALKPYQRLKMVGVIRNTFQNAPWIEVDDFTPLPGTVDTATLTHLYRGEKF